MRLRVMMALTAIGGSLMAGGYWVRAKVGGSGTRRPYLMDGDRYDVDEMLAAFGTTQDWV